MALSHLGGASISTAVTVVGPLSQALALAAEAGDVGQLRDIHATATALQKGAQARGMGLDAENQAAEVILRAERAIGTALMSVPRSVTGPAKGVKGTKGSTSKDSQTPFEAAVEAAGLSANPKAVHQYQALARVSADEFEDKFGAVKATGTRLSKIDFYRMARPTPVKTPDSEVYGDPGTPAFLNFRKAVDALHLIQLPDGELAEVGVLIRDLVRSYNAERGARA